MDRPLFTIAPDAIYFACQRARAGWWTLRVTAGYHTPTGDPVSVSEDFDGLTHDELDQVVAASLEVPPYPSEWL